MSELTLFFTSYFLADPSLSSEDLLLRFRWPRAGVEVEVEAEVGAVSEGLFR
jgi:hypothetical protein